MTTNPVRRAPSPPEPNGLSAADRASNLLRQMLFDGLVRPGDRIDQDEIAGTLGISRQPVRDAVIDLAGEGILVIRPRHGVFVGRFDAETVRGHYELNGYLEAYAAARVARTRDAELLERLRRLHTVVETSSDPDMVAPASAQFYEAITTAARNPRLDITLRVLQRFVPGNVFARYPATLETARRYGAALLRAIERQEPEAAAAACTRQWAAGAELIVADLVARGIIQGDQRLSRKARRAIA
jgi:DNA-binding GntR family transcriptional regulator